MSESVSAACRVIRIGTFKFINAPNARTTTDLNTNLHLYPDHLTIQLPNHPEINVNSTEIRQILTFFGRELPRALMCVLVSESLARSIVATMKTGGDTSIAFCPSSKDIAERFIVLFPSDESSFEFQLLGDKFPWFSKRVPLRTDEARELVLATAGRQKTVSFIRDFSDTDETSKKSVVQDTQRTSVVDNEQTASVVDVQFKNNDENIVKNSPILLSPIFATPGAVKLLTRKELDHLALARAGKSVLRKRESDFSEEGGGVGKVRKAGVEEIDTIGDQSEIFTVPLCDLDKNGMYVEENTSEVVIENTWGDES